MTGYYKDGRYYETSSETGLRYTDQMTGKTHIVGGGYSSSAQEAAFQHREREEKNRQNNSNDHNQRY